MRLSLKAQRGAAIAIAAFALLFFWSQTAIFTFRIPQAGATVHPTDTDYRIVSVEKGGPADRAGLRAGDVGASDPSGIGPGDVLFSGVEQPPQRLHAVSLEIKRRTVTQHVTVRPDSIPYRWINRIRITARLLSYTVFLALGTWIVLLRPNLMTWMLFAFCAGTIAPTGDLSYVMTIWFGNDSHVNYVLDGIDFIFQRLPQSLLPLFALRFPNDATPGWRGRLFGPLLVVLASYFVGTWVVSLFFWTERNIDIVGWIDMALTLGTLAILATTYANSAGIDRQRLKWGFAGTAIGIGSDMANEFSRVISHHSELGINIGAIFTVIAVIMPICLGYAIIRHEIIDVRFVLNRTTVFTIVFAAFAAVFVLLDWLFTYYVTQSREETAIAMIAAFSLGFAVRAWRDGLVSAVDRVLFPRHYAEMMLLRDLRLTLERESRAEEVQRLLTQGAVSALNLSSAAIFARAADGGFVRQAATGWPAGTMWHVFPGDRIAQILLAHRSAAVRTADHIWTGLDVPDGSAKPVLAIPIVSRRETIAVVLYGSHTDSSDIDPDEAAALSQLCAAAGVTLGESGYVGTFPQAAAAAARLAR